MDDIDWVKQKFDLESEFTNTLLERWITTEVYDSLVNGMDEIKLENYSKAPIYCGNILDVPGCMISFPFEILYEERQFGTIHRKRFIGKVMAEMEKDSESKSVFLSILRKDAFVTMNLLQNINNSMDDDINTVFFPKLLFMSLNDPSMELLIFEDFCFYEGYRINDYKRDMPYQNALIVMEAYAKFHAGSLITQAERGKLELLCPELTVDAVTPGTAKYRLVLDAMQHTLEVNASLLERIGNLEETVVWLRKLKGNVLSTFLEGFIPSPKFKVLTHGSITENVIFFSHCETMVYLSSFGGAKLSSPATDINGFIFTCLSANMRNTKLKSLLEYYYKVFSSILIMSFQEVPFTFEELEQEVSNKYLIGVLSAIQNFPCLIGGRNFTSDYSYFNFTDFAKYKKHYSEKFELLFECSSFFRDKLLDFYKSVEAS